MTTVTCPIPTCRFTWDIGVTFTNVTITGAKTNVLVHCPNCGHSFDATGGGDGTFSTIGGRFRRVSQFVANADNSTLRRLQTELEEAQQQGDFARAQVTLQQAGVVEAGQARIDPSLLTSLITLLLTIIALVLQQRDAGDAPTKEQIDHLIQIEQQKIAPQGPASAPANPKPVLAPAAIKPTERNAPCPCGSNLKYKRCHGAPATSDLHPDNAC